MIKRFLKLAVILALAGIVLLGAVILYLVVGHSAAVTLPAPADSYPVGRVITTWTDESRPETLGDVAGRHRTLSAWIWYPAEKGGATVPYMPPDWARAVEADLGVGSFLRQAIDSIHTHATDARPSSQGGPFPLLVFEPGLGPLIPYYTTLAEDLASRGYIVVGLNPTYSAPITIVNGQVIMRSDLGNIADDATAAQVQQRGDELVAVWAADDRFAIDMAMRMNGDANSPFAGRLDAQHIGVWGHSLGGASALEACRLDARCSAAADLDGSPFGGAATNAVDRPVLLILSEPGNNANTREIQKSDRDLAAVYDKAPQAYRVVIQGARHFNFTDFAVEFNPLVRLIGVIGSIDGARGLRIASDYLAAFFDQTLKGHPSPLLHGPSKDYPEAQFTFH